MYLNRWIIFAICYCAAAANLFAFTLVGQYAPWMTSFFSYHQDGDVGGPMDITEGYRWNVPVVTYGFDQEFIDYFGEPGVEAVEDAIAILNALPAASELNLED